MSTLKVNTLTDTAATKSVPIEDVVNGTARAWVNFDGTFATSPFTIANGGIRAAYNVTSVTDLGTGNYQVNFTNSMSDANYVPVVSVERTGNPLNAKGAIATNASSSTQIRTTNEAQAATDMEGVYVAVFR